MMKQPHIRMAAMGLAVALALALTGAPAALAGQPQNQAPTNDPSVAALDALVKGKQPAPRDVPMRVDVVGYEIPKGSRVEAQLKAVANAGGGGFSTAGIKDIGQVMTGIVSGQPTTPTAQPQGGGRLKRGDTVIRHGRVNR